jgi:hypothetical protein
MRLQGGAESSTNQTLWVAGLLGFMAAWALARSIGNIHDAMELLMYIVFCGMPMLFIEVRTHQKRANLREVDKPERRFAWSRTTTKMVGLWSTLTLLAIGYRLIPEYASDFYRPVWVAAGWSIGPVFLLSYPYIVWIDSRMKEPNNGYWQAGMLIRGRWALLDWTRLGKFSLGWLIKGFFLPLMLGGAAAHYVVLREHGVDVSTFGHLYSRLFNALLAIDVTFGALGYLLTIRATDGQIRTVDCTWLGWLAALCCYAPFSELLWGGVLNYQGATSWSEWLIDSPIHLITWGFAILVLQCIYAWSTCSFGIRFSNLTNRGIITHGPHRIFKHPAYLSENISWWLVSVPFLAGDSFRDALRRCICLAINNAIYFLRAWTEERHLRSDPAYRSYCQWMRSNNLLTRLRQ